MTATSPSLTSRAMTRVVTELMVDTPQANPSSPSMRLTALVSATIQMMVTGTDRTPNSQ